MPDEYRILAVVHFDRQRRDPEKLRAEFGFLLDTVIRDRRDVEAKFALLRRPQIQLQITAGAGLEWAQVPGNDVVEGDARLAGLDDFQLVRHASADLQVRRLRFALVGHDNVIFARQVHVLVLGPTHLQIEHGQVFRARRIGGNRGDNRRPRTGGRRRLPRHHA